MKLRAADVSDLSTVLTWITTEAELRMWAGPNVRYPATPDSAWFDMEATGDNTYALVDSNAAIIGFGQVLARDDNVFHLARLIVEPDLRGQGVGRHLCVALIDMGTPPTRRNPSPSMCASRIRPLCGCMNRWDSRQKRRPLPGRWPWSGRPRGGLMRCSD